LAVQFSKSICLSRYAVRLNVVTRKYTIRFVPALQPEIILNQVFPIISLTSVISNVTSSSQHVLRCK
ncbi:hypothetical protein, partial [Xylanibacillus composti]|uniref:hypothetical protein n=1 Tax=Xylanibacillus composti TaxID=1572762 RepID=UPI001BCB7D05